jgi:hypothetical protein
VVLPPEIITVIGVIIGAFATYFSAYLIENRRERIERRKQTELKKGIVTIVRQELERHHKFLDSHLVKSKFVPSDNAVKVVGYRDSFMRDFNDHSRQYINISAEVKARVFDSDTLLTLEKVYRDIQEFNLSIENIEGSINLAIHNVKDGLRAINNMKIEP